ncbi:MAG: hypothetical protein H6R26_930 [Proteobacteria bacterium]|nr:hypothetical protein [Pseudomonadota bacterium]
MAALALLSAAQWSGCALAGGPVIGGNPGIGSGSSIFVIPPDPHTNDAIAISYQRRSCGAERIDIASSGNDIEITVTYDQTCLFALPPVPPQTILQSPGALYGHVELGYLPAGNYRVRLYYRDLSEGSNSRSFATTELFSVMPSR